METNIVLLLLILAAKTGYPLKCYQKLWKDFDVKGEGIYKKCARDDDSCFVATYNASRITIIEKDCTLKRSCTKFRINKKEEMKRLFDAKEIKFSCGCQTDYCNTNDHASEGTLSNTGSLKSIYIIMLAGIIVKNFYFLH